MTEISIDALRPALRSVADRLTLGLAPAQIDALLAYRALLQRWNATYNLTALREPNQMLTQHLADCLAIVGPLRRHVGTASRRVLDVGSGGGLPGVVLAIVMPALDVTCVDTVGKKAAFVQQVAGELRLRNLHARHARVEQLKEHGFDIVMSRAFAALADFIRLTRNSLGADGVWLAMKGKSPADELAQLPADIDVFHVEQLEVPGLDAERCLVWMRGRAKPSL